MKMMMKVMMMKFYTDALSLCSVIVTTALVSRTRVFGNALSSLFSLFI